MTMWHAERTDYEIMWLRTRASKLRCASPVEIERKVQLFDSDDPRDCVGRYPADCIGGRGSEGRRHASGQGAEPGWNPSEGRAQDDGHQEGPVVVRSKPLRCECGFYDLDRPHSRVGGGRCGSST